MEKKREIGDYFEKISKNYLIKKGLKFIDEKYYSKFGEIDLIFLDSKNNTLVFIEVKYRKNSKYGSALEVINKEKIEKIKITSNLYISKVKWKENIRYDIIGIMKKNSEKYSIKWIKNAF